MDDFVWLDGGKSLLWLSERDGWRHAYAVSRDGQDVRLLTPGDYDVMSVDAVDEKGGRLYVTASPDDRDASGSSTASGWTARGSPSGSAPPSRPASTEYDISPSARWAFHTYSTLDKPPVDRARPSAQGRRRPAAGGQQGPRGPRSRPSRGSGPNSSSWISAAASRSTAGASCRPTSTRPRNTPCSSTSTASRPARRCRTAGAAAATSGTCMLAQQGYIVASFDNRGTPAPARPGLAEERSTGRSASWPRPTRPRRSGRPSPPGPIVDPDRVGIWGWSGGGSMTLNAMFRYPDLYKTGHLRGLGARPASLRHDLPGALHGPARRTTPEGYKNGSPITFAKDLKGEPADRPRHGRRQRPLPGLRGAGQRARGRQQGLHDDGLPEPLARHLRGAGHDAPPLHDVSPAFSTKDCRRAGEHAKGDSRAGPFQTRRKTFCL